MERPCFIPPVPSKKGKQGKSGQELSDPKEAIPLLPFLPKEVLGSSCSLETSTSCELLICLRRVWAFWPKWRARRPSRAWVKLRLSLSLSGHRAERGCCVGTASVSGRTGVFIPSLSSFSSSPLLHPPPTSLPSSPLSPDRVSYSPSWPRTCCLAEDNLEILILLSPPKC